MLYEGPRTFLILYDFFHAPGVWRAVLRFRGFEWAPQRGATLASDSCLHHSGTGDNLLDPSHLQLCCKKGKIDADTDWQGDWECVQLQWTNSLCPHASSSMSLAAQNDQPKEAPYWAHPSPRWPPCSHTVPVPATWLVSRITPTALAPSSPRQGPMSGDLGRAPRQCGWLIPYGRLLTATAQPKNLSGTRFLRTVCLWAARPHCIR